MSQHARPWPSRLQPLLALAFLLATLSLNAQADLDVSWTGPGTYTPGTTATYTLVITNTDTDDPVAPFAVSTAFPGTVSLSWSCQNQDGAPLGCQSASSSGTGNINYGGAGIAEGGSLTYVFQASFASSMTADPLNVNATVDGDNFSFGSTLALQTELSVSKDTSPPGGTTYVPGDSGAYLIQVTNAGPSDAAGVTVIDTLPGGVTATGWTCSASGGASCPSGSGGGSLNETINVAAGGTLSFVLNVQYAANLTDPVTNEVEIQVPANLNDSSGASAYNDSVTLNPDLQVDLVVTVDSGSLPDHIVAGGDAETVTFTVRNDGPSRLGSAAVFASLPFDDVDNASWTCSSASLCSEVSGDNQIGVEINLDVDQSVTLVQSLSLASSALGDDGEITLSLSALAGLNHTELDEESATTQLQLDLRREAAIAVTKTNNRDAANPGEALVYEIEVRNLGPSDLGNVTDELGVLLTDNMPAGLGANPEECPGASSPNDPPCWRLCPSNNTDIPDAGGQNSEDCPVERVLGTGNISNQSIALTAGGSSTVFIHASIRNDASGIIENTAQVEVTDPDIHPVSAGSLSDQDTDLTTVDISTDLQVNKTTGPGSAVPGEEFSFVVTLTNAGFIAANNSRLIDELPIFDAVNQPAGFEPGTIRFQCRAFDGACCNHNSSNCGASTPTSPVFADSIDHGVDLPPQSSVEFTITGKLDTRATGLLENEASALTPPGIEEADESSAVDTASINLAPAAGLGIEKNVTGVSEIDGENRFTIGYELIVTSSGPSFAPGVTVTDQFTSSALDAGSAQWSCEVISGGPNTSCEHPGGSSGPLDSTVDLDPGAVVRYEISIDTVLDPEPGPIVNTAQASSALGLATDQASTTVIGSAELEVIKDNNRFEAAPGNSVDYVIRIQNHGPSDVFGVSVIDEFPAELENVVWQCEATTPVPGDLAPLSPEMVGTSRAAGQAVVASADGRHVYVAGSTLLGLGSLFVFDRNNVPGLNFGVVVPLETETEGVNDPSDPGGTVRGLHAPVDIAMNPGNQFVYVLSETATIDDEDVPAAIAVFSRNTNPLSANYGRLTFVDRVTDGVPEDARRLVVTTGNVYVSGDEVVAVFQRDLAGGLPNFDIDFEDHGLSAPGPMAFDAGRLLLFVADAAGTGLAALDILPAGGGNPAGRLAVRASATSSNWNSAFDLQVVPASAQLYLSATGAGRLSLIQYGDLDGDGLVDDIVYGAEDPQLESALAAGARVDVAGDGEHLIGASADSNVLFQYRRDTISGGLSELEFVPASPTRDPSAAAISSDGRHVLVASASTEEDSAPLSVFSRRAPDPLFAFIQADRRGDQGGLVQGMQAPNDVAVSPDGAHVYVLSLPDNALTVFRRHVEKGLTEDSYGEHLEYITTYFDGVNGFVGLDQPRRLLISPSGDNVYVSSEARDSLVALERDNDSNSPTYGRLSPIPDQHFRTGDSVPDPGDGPATINALLGAKGLAMDPLGRHLYVAGSFDATIGIFRRDTEDGSLKYIGRAAGGQNGATGMSGIRDLAVSPDGRQVLGVSTISNALVVFDRDSETTSVSFGQLSFLQAQLTNIGTRPVALHIPGGQATGGGDHVYVVSEISSTVAVLRRVTDPGSSAFGRVQPIQIVANNSGVSHMSGPRDVRVSPDGRKVYVAAQNSSALLVFDRDLNASSISYGHVNLAETRRHNVDGVKGLAQVRSLAVSPDSRNVYAASFGDSAVSSFRLGVGSVCSAGGSGLIMDLADIGAGGTVEYRASATIRADAVGDPTNVAGCPAGTTGRLVNTVDVILPSTISPISPDVCTGGGDFCDTDLTCLVPAGDVSVEKVSNTVSVVAGETVEYEITIRNTGPSNLVHDPDFPLTLTDELDANPGLVSGSAAWTCEASGSGALSFVEATFGDADSGPFGMDGLVSLTAVDAAAGGSPIDLMIGASVLDDAVVVFERDPVSGQLGSQLAVLSGSISFASGQQFSALDGARSVTASADGRFVYVASRVADSVSVFGLGDDGNGGLQISPLAAVTGVTGLNQANHLVLSPLGDQQQLYVAGANDNAIAVFDRDPTDGLLTHVQSIQHGSNGVSGLLDVDYLAISPNGRSVYALSSSIGTIALFDREPATGELTWRNTWTGADFGVSTTGASAAVLDSAGQYLYLAAGLANRILVLQRDTSAGGTHGMLSLASAITQGTDQNIGLSGVRRLAISADDNHVYATSQPGSSVAWFVRDAGDGSLSFSGLQSNASVLVDGIGGATGLALSASGEHLYVAGSQQNAIGLFQRQFDSFCPASGTGSIESVPFNIAAGGMIVFRIVATVAPDFTGQLVNEAIVEAARDPSGSISSDSDSTVVSPVADLSITKDDGNSEYDGLAAAAAVDGHGPHLYVAGAGDNAIGVYKRESDPGSSSFGQLGFVQVVRSGDAGVTGLTGVADVRVSDDGYHVYAVSPSDNTVVVLSRNPADGRLTPLQVVQNGIDGVSGLSGARTMAFSPDGAHVYVGAAFSNAIAVFRRDDDPGSAQFGRLSFVEAVQEGVAGVAGIAAPRALAVSPDGLQVYALGDAADTLAVLLRNPTPASANFGRLSYLTHYSNADPTIAGLDGVRDLLIDAAGDNVYVLGDDPGTLVHLSRQSSGELSFVEFLSEGFGTTEGLTGARALRAGPGGTSLYVVGGDQSSIARYTVDPDDATLLFADIVVEGDDAPLTGGQVFGLGGANSLWFSPDGAHGYVTSSDNDALLAFAVTADSPVLSFLEILIDGLGGVAPGETVLYLITVENHGPSDVPQARVIDEFPEQFEAVDWSCVGTNGGQCPTDGTGNIDVIVSLPVGGRVTFAAGGPVAADASGRLINVASVTGIGVVDPNPDNNIAVDDDTVLSPAMDLVVEISSSQADATPGDWIDFLVTVNNLGPSDARGIRIEDELPPALVDVSWECTASPAAGLLSPVSTVSGDLDMVSALFLSGDGRFAYATGEVAGSGAIGVFRRDLNTGALTPRQTLIQGDDGVAGIRGASDLVIAPDGRFVYVAGPDSDSVAVFERDVDDGELTFLAQYQDGDLGISAIGGVHRLLMGPGGNVLYAGSLFDEALVAFAINPASGLLTQIGQVRQGIDGVDGLSGISDLTLSADGSVLLVTAVANESLAAFAIDADTGLLAPVDVLLNFQLAGSDALLNARSVIVVGDEIFVAAAGGDQVSRFELDEDTLIHLGAVEDITGLPDGFDAPRSLRYVSDQARLYVIDDAGLHLLSLLDETPELLETYLAADHAGVEGFDGIAISPNLRQLYTRSSLPGAGVTTWARERGSRCPINGLGALGGHAVDIVPDGELVYEISARVRANAIGELVYLVEAVNPLPEQELNPASNLDVLVLPLVPRPDLGVDKQAEPDEVVAGETIEFLIAMDNAGLSDALVARLIDQPPVFPETGGILADSGAWSCQANPALDFLGDHVLDDAIDNLVIGQAGYQAYAVSRQASALMLMPLSPDGSLGSPQVIAEGDQLGGQTVAGMSAASAVAVSADERHIYVTGKDDNSLVVLVREAPGQPLSFAQQFTSGANLVAGLEGPRALTLTPDERHLYVASATSNAVAIFSRDVETGELEYVDRVRDGFGTIAPDFNVIQGPAGLAVDRHGEYLYVVASQSSAVSVFSINAASGNLAYREVWRQGEGGMVTLGQSRDLVTSPGDRHLYTLGDGGIALFERQPDGLLQPLAEYTDDLVDLIHPIRLAIDGDGSRLYLLDAGDGDNGPVVHVLERDWNDGTLSLHESEPLSQLVSSVSVYSPATATLYLGGADPAALIRYEQRPLSRCQQLEGQSDHLDKEIRMGAQGWSEVAYSATVHPSARGELINTALIETLLGEDPDTGNNSSTTVTPILVVSDLTVTKTGPEEVVAGLGIDYEIIVTNAGPSDALGIQVTDLAPAALTDITWTCQASGDSSCPASGTDAPDFTANVMVDQPLTIQMSAIIDSAFVGNLVNVVELTPEVDADDPNPEGQTDQHETNVIAIADVSVTKQTLTSPVVAGLPIEYLIVVSNAGPSDASAVQVLDNLSPKLLQASWSCTPLAGADCPDQGFGDIDFFASIPVGASLEIMIEALVDPAESGTVGNNVGVTVHAPASDPDTSNNSAGVVDSILVRPDLSLALEAPLNPFDPGGSIDLPIVVHVANAGPSQARNVTVDLALTESALQTAAVPCDNQGSQFVRCQLGTIDPGDELIVELALGELPEAPSEITIDGSVNSSGTDPDPDNNVDSVTVELLSGGDVWVRIDNGFDWLSPNQPVTYEVVVENIGSAALDTIDFELPIPVELIDVSWTCSGTGQATCLPSGTSDISDALSLASGERVTYLIDALVDPDIDLSTPQSVTMIGTATVTPPQADINPLNNIAVKDDPLRYEIFVDGFESLLESGSSIWQLPDEQAAAACTGLTLVLDHLPLLATPAAGRLLEARAASGDLLLWLDALQREDGHWLRLGYLGDDRAAHFSDWLAWRQPSLEIGLTDQTPLLRAAEGESWQGPVALASAALVWRLPTLGLERGLSREIEFSGCQPEWLSGDQGVQQ